MLNKKISLNLKHMIIVQVEKQLLYTELVIQIVNIKHKPRNLSVVYKTYSPGQTLCPPGVSIEKASYI